MNSVRWDIDKATKQIQSIKKILDDHEAEWNLSLKRLPSPWMIRTESQL